MPARNQTFIKRTSKSALADGAKRLSFATNARRLAVAIGREASANFKSWFERNFANPRAGRIGGMSYSRAGELDDRPGDWTWYPSAYGRAFWDHTEPLTPDEEDYLRSHPLVLIQLALGVTDLRGLRCLRRGLTLRTNSLQQKAYRSRYYAHDNARRRQLAAERRKIHRRTTTSPCPTPDEFRAAFTRVKESVAAKIRFGGMVHDLACYVDSCLRYDEAGNIVGRNGGIRAWVAENTPELSSRYKTIMRYKALAMRVRQLTGLKDPHPTSTLLENLEGGTTEKLVGETGQPSASSAKAHGNENPNRTKRQSEKSEAMVENYYAQDSHFIRELTETSQLPGRARWRLGGARRWPDGPRNKQEHLEQKRRRLGQVLTECRNTFKDVFDRIDSGLGLDKQEFE